MGKNGGRVRYIASNFRGAKYSSLSNFSQFVDLIFVVAAHCRSRSSSLFVGSWSSVQPRIF